MWWSNGPCDRGIGSIVSDMGACPGAGGGAGTGHSPATDVLTVGGADGTGLPAGGDGVAVTGAGSGLAGGGGAAWRGEGALGDSIVTVDDRAAEPSSPTANRRPQPIQNRVPGSTECPQDGHQLSIPTIVPLPVSPNRPASRAGACHPNGATRAS
jgi:hypothetical protein